MADLNTIEDLSDADPIENQLLRVARLSTLRRLVPLVSQAFKTPIQVISDAVSLGRRLKRPTRKSRAGWTVFLNAALQIDGCLMQMMQLWKDAESLSGSVCLDKRVSELMTRI
ncbi:MAG: hypothetical protein CME19_07455 [Gemmatimonadetes bacterium]|nr:hypothetical protein [Gemmatimonadota bacterium]